MRKDELYCPGDAQWREEYINDNEITIVSLPHSCDNWKIGGPNEVRLLISDLERLLEDSH
jgi:hypothetical protein